MYVCEGDIQQIYYRIIPGILRDKTINDKLTATTLMVDKITTFAGYKYLLKRLVT